MEMTRGASSDDLLTGLFEVFEVVFDRPCVLVSGLVAQTQPLALTFMLYRLTGSALGRRGRVGTGVASLIGPFVGGGPSSVVEVAGVVEDVGEASWEEPRDDEDTRWDTSLVVWPLVWLSGSGWP
jgi:hypothetical protein